MSGWILFISHADITPSTGRYRDESEGDCTLEKMVLEQQSDKCHVFQGTIDGYGSYRESCNDTSRYLGSVGVNGYSV